AERHEGYDADDAAADTERKSQTRADAYAAMVCNLFGRFRRIILDRTHAQDFSRSNVAEKPPQDGRRRAEREALHPGSCSRTNDNGPAVGSEFVEIAAI